MNKRITLITNIKSLIYDDVKRKNTPVRGKDMHKIKEFKNAYLLTVDDIIADIGTMSHCEQNIKRVLTPEEINLIGRVDAKKGYVIPGFCDSHTHILFPNSREQEMFYRNQGLTYTQITAKGGGILNSAKLLPNMSDEELLEPAIRRMDGLLRNGTTTIEVKSGYGLSPEQELRILRLIKTLQENTDATIKSTFLGAHAIPAQYAKHPDKYVKLIIEKMIPEVAEERLADYIDVFCEEGFFDIKQTEKILDKAILYGLKPRIHSNQFNSIGGINVGLEHNSISLDHLENLDKNEIKQIAKSDTIATLLPGYSFFMNEPYAPARKLIDAGAAIALASDFNPGTNPSGSMPFILSLACLKMKLKVEEALNAATINGAAALDLDHTQGSIAVGKRADFIITKPIPSLEYLPYAYAESNIETVFCGGKWI